jgi:hypothetical protein
VGVVKIGSLPQSDPENLLDADSRFYRFTPVQLVWVRGDILTAHERDINGQALWRSRPVFRVAKTRTIHSGHLVEGTL